MIELRETALEILLIKDAELKVARLYRLYDDYQLEQISLDLSRNFDSQNLDLPGQDPPQLRGRLQQKCL